MEKEKQVTFNPADWFFERSSGYAGYRNKITAEWIYESDFRKRERKLDEEKVWEEEVFRIIKLRTKSDDLTQQIVDELKERIIVYKKD